MIYYISMKTMLSFHNDEQLKEQYVNKMLLHAKADEIRQGFYWENGKGCATGCLMENPRPHSLYPIKIGVPESIAYLEDKIFEGLPNEDAKQFAVDFVKAIPVGADLSKVEYRFKLWLLTDKYNGVIKYANEETKKIIRQIAKLHKKMISGESVSDEDWSAAYKAMAKKLIKLLKEAK